MQVSNISVWVIALDIIGKEISNYLIESERNTLIIWLKYILIDWLSTIVLP